MRVLASLQQHAFRARTCITVDIARPDERRVAARSRLIDTKANYASYTNFQLQFSTSSRDYISADVARLIRHARDKQPEPDEHDGVSVLEHS
jgi:hypothetical protein